MLPTTLFQATDLLEWSWDRVAWRSAGNVASCSKKEAPVNDLSTNYIKEHCTLTGVWGIAHEKFRNIRRLNFLTPALLEGHNFFGASKLFETSQNFPALPPRYLWLLPWHDWLKNKQININSYWIVKVEIVCEIHRIISCCIQINKLGAI